MWCSQCGTHVDDASRFCASCGMPVSKASPSPASSPAEEVTLDRVHHGPFAVGLRWIIVAILGGRLMDMLLR
jgi:hypothetical protein